jgi:pimeloyl-ACP methyl ester carboxylesterase
MKPEGIMDMTTTNATNIVLIHGACCDGSAWSKEILVLKNAEYRVIAVQLPPHSLTDDVATVKSAIEQFGGPTILWGIHMLKL